MTSKAGAELLANQPRDEIVLSLEEPLDRPESPASVEQDASTAESPVRRNILLTITLVCLALGGWFIYSQFWRIAIQRTLQPLAVTHAPRVSAPPASKDAAWGTFFSPPPFCEHPVDWDAQVECGNRYMRAKRLFEQRWAAEHPSRQSGTDGIVLDNAAVGDLRKSEARKD